jgi:hypothetical protein
VFGAVHGSRFTGARDFAASRFRLDCQSMPTNHAAVRHALSRSAARQPELAFLDA